MVFGAERSSPMCAALAMAFSTSGCNLGGPPILAMSIASESRKRTELSVEDLQGSRDVEAPAKFAGRLCERAACGRVYGIGEEALGAWVTFDERGLAVHLKIEFEVEPVPLS